MRGLLVTQASRANEGRRCNARVLVFFSLFVHVIFAILDFLFFCSISYIFHYFLGGRLFHASGFQFHFVFLYEFIFGRFYGVQGVLLGLFSTYSIDKKGGRGHEED